MPLVTLIMAKTHLRVTHAAEDELIGLYLGAAAASVTEFLQRAVFATQAELDAAKAAAEAEVPPAEFDANAMVVNDAVRAALLLKLGDLFANREDTIVGTIASELPSGSKALLMPYRVRMGV